MSRRELVLEWLSAGITAVQPDTLAESALLSHEGPGRVISIGKAAAGLCMGAEAAIGDISGLCITNHPSPVPGGVELLIGEHPVPGRRSLNAGMKALEYAGVANIALIGGGGSALCEVPRRGMTIDDLADVNRHLLAGGASIEETNLVRRHLSRVKGGGLGPIPTYVLSDVAGADPGVVSSGPTIPARHEPETVLTILGDYGIDFDARLEAAVRHDPKRLAHPSVTVIGDGRTAARAIAEAVGEVAPARVVDSWLTGDFEPALRRFVDYAPTGVSLIAGEPSVEAHGDGKGGRNTHSALRAAQLIEGTDFVFAALASDGEDGNSGSAGAIVDGQTIVTGGDPSRALSDSDSAGYLAATDALIEFGPTGTNVADIWLIWKP